MKLDLGDVELSLELLIKARQRRRFVLRASVPRPTTPEDRVVKGPPYHQHTGKVDLIMDLAADMQVTLSGAWTDEVGNPVDAPADASVVYTVDDPTIINLTDNGDGPVWTQRENEHLSRQGVGRRTRDETKTWVIQWQWKIAPKQRKKRHFGHDNFETATCRLDQAETIIVGKDHDHD